jgi:hypothetical protein
MANEEQKKKPSDEEELTTLEQLEREVMELREALDDANSSTPVSEVAAMGAALIERRLQCMQVAIIDAVEQQESSLVQSLDHFCDEITVTIAEK